MAAEAAPYLAVPPRYHLQMLKKAEFQHLELEAISASIPVWKPGLILISFSGRHSQEVQKQEARLVKQLLTGARITSVPTAAVRTDTYAEWRRLH